MRGTAQRFFEKTLITQGMQDLIAEGIARLGGRVVAGSLPPQAGHGRRQDAPARGLRPAGEAPGAAARVLRGRHAMPMPLRAPPSRHSTAATIPDHFFWGEIAKQLGKGEQFRSFWTAGPKAPDEKDWLKLFDGDRPVLILLDEMPPYFHYLDTQKVGNGTVADIATRAFANLLTAAGKKKNVCVVVSDLAAAYDTGGKLINRALQDARAELGRQERNITPVDLAANEIYDILRKRLFKSLPDKAEIDDIASAYRAQARGGRQVQDRQPRRRGHRRRDRGHLSVSSAAEERRRAVQGERAVQADPRPDRARLAPAQVRLGAQGQRRLPDRPAALRPLHRGSARQAHRNLRDARRHRQGPLGRPAIRTRAGDRSRTGKDAATQVGALLLTASLSTAVNAVKGLTREEMVECLVSPLREPSEFLAAFDELEKVAWYLHHTPEGRFYFDRQENLTKLLQSLAHDAPENQIDDLIRHRLARHVQANPQDRLRGGPAAAAARRGGRPRAHAAACC